MTQPLLRCEHIEKSFGERLVLDVAHLALYPATHIQLTGKNGSGKTTLLKVVAGLLTPEQLVVHSNGKQYSGFDAKRELRANVVYMHQQTQMFDTSVADNIAYGLRRAGIRRPDVRERVRDALDWVDLSHVASASAKHLSQGERQLVALARAWATRPRVLLLDEPFVHMDAEARAQTYFLLRRIVAFGTCAVTATQDVHPLANIDRHLFLSAGELQELTRDGAANDAASMPGRRQSDN